MWIVYEITDPNRLSEVKIPTATEVREYLDLCLKFSDDFPYGCCLQYWQDHRNMYNQPDYLPFMIADRCANVLQAYLKLAEIELSEHDRDLLERAKCEKWSETEKLVTEGVHISIEDFATLFENRYLKEALRILMRSIITTSV